MTKIAAVNFGKTSTTAAIGLPGGQILEKAIFTTSDNPENTLEDVFAYLERKEFDLIGICTFGPVDLDRTSPTYGCLLKTPRKGWINFDLIGPFRERFDMPINLDTDVNAACLAEHAYGAGIGMENMLYMAIGSGIGAGALVQGALAKGFQHSEMGHIPMVVHPDDDFIGTCPYHHTCLEGLAGAKAIEERWKEKPENLPAYHEAWDMEAWYIAQALVIYIMTLCPDIIILSGGIMKQNQLFPMIIRYVHDSLGGYIPNPKLEMSQLSSYIVPSGCHDHPELLGALYLGEVMARKIQNGEPVYDDNKLVC